MVSTTPVFGRQVPKPLLSAGILGLYGGLGFYFSRPNPNAPPSPAPAAQAQGTSGEEEDFIKQFLAEAEKEDEKAK